MTTSEKEIKRGAVLSTINTLLGIITTFLITPLVLEQLGDEQYGLYCTVGALVSGITLLNFGLNSSMVRFIAKYRSLNDKESEEKYYGMCMILFIIIAALALAVGIFVILNIGSLNSVHDWQVTAARIMMGMMCFNMVFNMVTQVFPSILTAYEHFTFLRGWELFRNIAIPILKIIIIKTHGIDALIIIIIDVLFNVIYQIMVIIYAKKKIKFRFRFRGIEKSMISEVFNYSFFIFIALLVDMLYWKTDTYILAAFCDNQQISQLNLANHFSDYFIRIATMLCGMMMTKVVTMVINNASGHELTNAMIKLGRIQFLILGLILVGYILCGRHFVDQWAKGNFDHSRIYLMGLMLLIPLMVPEIEILGISILQAKNMHRFRSIVYFCIAVLNVAISIPLAKKLGALGATIGTSVSLIIGHIIIMNIYYKKAVGIEVGRFFKETCRGTLPAALITLALGSVTMLLPRMGLPSLFLKMTIVCVIYCAAQWLIGMNDYEKDILRSAVSAGKRKFGALKAKLR